MTRRIASLVSNIFSPFLSGLIIILLVSLEANTDPFETVKWVSLLVGLSLLPVLIYIIYLLRRKRLDGFSSSSRQQRAGIYVLMLILGSVSCLTLFWLKAPLMLVALAVAGLSGAIIFGLFNLWCKISLHTAFVAALVAVFFLSYGLEAAASLLLIPLVAWSRIVLEQHSVMQTIAGALMGAMVLLLTFLLLLKVLPNAG